jgi:hypothetical protein
MFRTESFRPVASRIVVLAVAAAALSGCASDPAPPSGGSGNPVFALFRSGSASAEPPAAAVAAAEGRVIEDIECPMVEVLDGGAALRTESGGTVRSQLSMGQTARECTLVGNQISIKIGVEGLALLGPTGTPGTFSAPVRFVAKRGDKVVASRFQRTSVTIPAGQAQASFIVVEDNILVPVDGPELTLIVGFDAQGRAAEEPRRKRS